jgi:hypothetical protein
MQRVIDRFCSEHPEFVENLRARIKGQDDLGDLMVAFFQEVRRYGFDSEKYSDIHLFGELTKICERKDSSV